ncbi:MULTISPECIES: hypothetical protein [unclassified Caballeronia]|uniref:hypothetical protein n=1 Tax=unclassified Caballeronia TaxID=2646786 RepID=UPI0020278A73|nr:MULTISPECIES: hypothetical protein [unclassified Caballeronia]MDR5765935.1 hypothetical protein [Caballeronia sp. LZ028]
MIISPPFLPAEGLNMPAEKWKTDPMMDVVDTFELSHSGVFPIAFDRRWHCGMHVVPFGGLGQLEPVRAIADGEVVAYRVSLKAISDGQRNADGTEALNSNIGFVLLKHVTDTGEGRTITFYSLYMHLLDLVKTNELSPQPNHPASDSSPNALPAWLLAETDGVQAGAGKKVFRKDRLGFRGRYQGEAHLHFEIFMTEEDFIAYFEQDGHKVALGEAQPTTPASKDYWGSTYFVIPGGSTFVSVPAGLGDLKTKGRSPKPFFPALDTGALNENSTLYVETYFNRGERFMRAWIDRGDGKPVPVTSDFARDKFEEYEYGLYERATALYGTCPSEGFELLRFGRILSTDTPTLTATEQATWVSVPFAEGKTGYIDINQAGIQKLSDADFPSFMHWQKIEDGNTPFDQDGLCGYDTLCRIAGATDSQPITPSDMTSEFSHDQQVAALVQRDVSVRAKLKGFICHARSEWDAGNNDQRYGWLNEPEGFFGKREDTDPHGYENFINFVKRCQFLAQTPLGEGKKFWFFHPLAFIRHFRKCGWLNHKEFANTFPRYPYYTNNGSPASAITTNNSTYVITKSTAIARIQNHVIALNQTIRKYLGADARRTAIFLAQVLLETAQWRNLGGVRRLLSEWGFGKYSAVNPATQFYGPFYGRGIMQLTWAGNFSEYGTYRALPAHVGPYVERLPNSPVRITETSEHYNFNPRDGGMPMRWFPRFDPDRIAEEPPLACDSGGFYWVSKAFSQGQNINRVADKEYSADNIGLINRLVNGGFNGYNERQAYTIFIMNELWDATLGYFPEIIAPTRRTTIKPDLTRSNE